MTVVTLPDHILEHIVRMLQTSFDIINMCMGLYDTKCPSPDRFRKHWCVSHRKSLICCHSHATNLVPSLRASRLRYSSIRSHDYWDSVSLKRVKSMLDRVCSVDYFDVDDIKSVWAEYVEALRRELVA